MVTDMVDFRSSAPRRKGSEEGSTLLVALIMLLLMSMIGVGAMQSTILQERMSTNLLDRELAFQAAEAALREAEQRLHNKAFGDPLDFPNANGLYRNSSDAAPDWPDDLSHSAGDVQEYGGDIDGVSRAPEYYIEVLDSIPVGSTEAGIPPSYPFFRITALGYGGSDNTRVVLTSVYRNQ